MYAFVQRSDKASPRQIRQLSYIAQFTKLIEHIPESSNDVADPLSRIESLRLPLEISLNELAEQHASDNELTQLRASPNP